MSEEIKDEKQSNIDEQKPSAETQKPDTTQVDNKVPYDRFKAKVDEVNTLKQQQEEMEAKLKRLEELEKAEEERKKAEMSEQERLLAEKEEAENKAAELAEKAEKAEEAANKRIIDTEIRAVARALNANDINDVLALMDKSGVEIDESGNVKGVEEAVASLKESKPWMFKKPIGADAAGGSNPSKNPSLDEISAKEKELAELKQKAVSDRRLLGKVTRLANELVGLKAKNK